MIRRLLSLIKGLYDLLASYLLAWVVIFALVAWVFYGIATLLASGAGFESLESFWRAAHRHLPGGSTPWRLVFFGALHALWLWLARYRLRRLKARVEGLTDRVVARYRTWAAAHPRGRRVTGMAFTLLITLVLVPFLVQPTLVPLRWRADAWALRAANLLDGTATAALGESVVGLYRRAFAGPVVGNGVDDAGYQQTFQPEGPQPLVDRWDPMIRAVVGDDQRGFALVKAFVWVESAGRQFAVSRTGCAGLMQFCARTARARPYRAIFGTGQVYPCDCRGPCEVPRKMRRELESGRRPLIERHRDRFVCELSDARFEPKKSLTAGWTFIRSLDREFGGNIYLMYIGYNSGPHVSRRIWRQLRDPARADLERIGPHVGPALRPNFGGGAESRARGLVRVHLPKLARAYQRYRLSAACARARIDPR